MRLATIRGLNRRPRYMDEQDNVGMVLVNANAWRTKIIERVADHCREIDAANYPATPKRAFGKGHFDDERHAAILTRLAAVLEGLHVAGVFGQLGRDVRPADDAESFRLDGLPMLEQFQIQARCQVFLKSVAVQRADNGCRDSPVAFQISRCLAVELRPRKPATNSLNRRSLPPGARSLAIHFSARRAKLSGVYHCGGSASDGRNFCHAGMVGRMSRCSAKHSTCNVKWGLHQPKFSAICKNSALLSSSDTQLSDGIQSLQKVPFFTRESFGTSVITGIPRSDRRLR